MKESPESGHFSRHSPQAVFFAFASKGAAPGTAFLGRWCCLSKILPFVALLVALMLLVVGLPYT